MGKGAQALQRLNRPRSIQLRTVMAGWLFLGGSFYMHYRDLFDIRREAAVFYTQYTAYSVIMSSLWFETKKQITRLRIPVPSLTLFAVMIAQLRPHIT